MKMTNVGCLNFWLENNNLIVCKPHVLERKNMYFVSQSHVSRQEQAKKMIYSCLLYLISIRIHIWIYSYSYSYSYHHLQPSLSLIYSNRYLRLYIVRSFQKNLEFVLCCGWDGVRKSLNKLQRWDSVPYITAITSTTFFSSFIHA